MTTRPLHRQRLAFTLIELLVVMTVIGILIGLLAAGIIPAFKRANEFTIQTEITQLDAAVEKFNAKYGFYPPSFVQIQNPGDFNGDGNIDGLDSQAKLLRYINLVAPNHAENAVNPNTGNTYLFDWWNNVGAFIGYSSGEDLVFWLSGIAKNKQFPLSGNSDPSNNGGYWAFGNDPVNEREVFYDFDTDRLVIEDTDITDDNNDNNSLFGFAAGYLQPKGKSVNYLYIDNSSYGYGPGLLPAAGGPIFFDGFSSTPGNFMGNMFVMSQFYENPSTFQIVTFGMDGLVGAPWEPDTPMTSNFTTDWHFFNSNTAADNMCNFANGRLERMLLGTNN